jgi:hypothetical protein
VALAARRGDAVSNANSNSSQPKIGSQQSELALPNTDVHVAFSQNRPYAMVPENKTRPKCVAV